MDVGWKSVKQIEKWIDFETHMGVIQLCFVP